MKFLVNHSASTLRISHKIKNEREKSLVSGHSEIWHDFARTSLGNWCNTLPEQKGVKPLLYMKSQMTSRQQNEKTPWFHFLLLLEQMRVQLRLSSHTQGPLQLYVAQDFQYRSRTSFFARLGLVLRQRACISGKHSVPSSMLGISVVRKMEKRLDAFRPLGQSRKGEIFAGYLWNWCSGKPIHRSYLNLSLPSHLTDHSFWATRRTRDNGTLLLGMGSKTGLGAGKIPGPWGSLHSDHLL